MSVRSHGVRVLLLPAPYVHGTVGATLRALALARALTLRGCTVAFVAAGQTAEHAARDGYPVYRAPVPHPANTAVPIRSTVDSIVWTGLGEETFIRALLDVELAAARDFRAQVAWADFHPTAAVSMAAAGVPLASIALWASHPDFTPERPADPTADAFNGVLREFGQPPVETAVELLFMRSALRIAPTLPELEPELLAAVPDALFVGRIVDHSSLASEPPPASFSGWPPAQRGLVYMSVTGPPPHLLAEIVGEACRGTDLRAILATGFHVDASNLPSSSDHVQVVRYVAVHAILEECAFVVAHGGQNIVTDLVHYGVPSVQFPGDAVERDYNARQLVRAGGAIVLPLAAMRPRRLRESLLELLSGSYARNLVPLKERMRAAGGVGRAAEAIIELARTSSDPRISVTVVAA